MRRLPQPHQGRERGEAEGEVQVDTEQMDNVSSAIVLQLIINLRLKIADWEFISKAASKERCHKIITWRQH